MPLMFARDQSELKELRHNLIDSQDGAHVEFCGSVRAINKTKEVKYLFYEADEILAIKQFALLEERARALFGVRNIRAIHRVGLAYVGEEAVIIRASAAHRHEAFLAARFLIDELKSQVAIWKEEHYLDGSSVWDQGLCQCSEADTHAHAHAQSALLPVKKAFEHSRLSYEKIKNARVLLIGAGGLGCPIAINLAGLGLGQLSIFDGDSVCVSNLARQFIFGRDDAGHNKALVIKKFLKARFSWLDIKAHAEFLEEHQARELIPGFDLVIDSSDSMSTKIMLAKLCKEKRVAFICASVHSDEGEIAVISADAHGGCFVCWRQNLKQPKSCAQSGVFTHACARIAAFVCEQAMLFLNTGLKHNKLYVMGQSIVQELKIKRDPACFMCSEVLKKPLKILDIHAELR